MLRMPETMVRRVLPVAVGFVLLLAFFVRVIPAIAWVFPGPPATQSTLVTAGAEEGASEVRLFGNDPWFHLRHARMVAEDFPQLHRHDIWTNYPEGYTAPEVGLYAFGMATAAVVLGGGEPSEQLLRTVVAWTPVVLGVAAYGALMLVAGTLWGSGAGLLAGTLLLVYPGTFLSRSLLGFSDHHVAEVLLLLLVMLGLVRALPRNGEFADGRSEGSEGKWWYPALMALPLAIFYFTWNGAPIYLLFTALTLFVVCSAAVARGSGAGLGGTMFAYGAGFTVAIAGPGLLWPVLVQVPGVFQKVILFGVVVTLGLPAYLWSAEWLIRRLGWRRDRVAIAGLLVGLGALAGYLTFTSEGRWVWEILSVRRTSLVREHAAALNLGSFVEVASWPGLIALVAPLVALWRARQTAGMAWTVPLLLAGLALFFWAGTGDYDYMVAPMVALLATFVLVEGARPLLARSPRGRRVVMEGVGVAVLLLAPVAGLAGPGRPWPETEVMAELMLFNDGWSEALTWLERNTPEPAVPAGEGSEGDPRRAGIGTDGADSYGVVAGWDFGNFVATVGRRPVIWSQGPDTRTSSWLLAQGEAEAAEVLARLPGELRYFVVDAHTVGDFFAAYAELAGTPSSLLRQPVGDVVVDGRTLSLSSFGLTFQRSMAHRLYYGNGSEMERYRQVYRSTHRSLTGYVLQSGTAGLELRRVARPLNTPEQAAVAVGYAENPGQVVDLDEAGLLYFSRIEPTVKIFERVAGAVLVGEGPPGATVRAVTILRSGVDEALLDYRRSTVVGEGGRYAIRVPYSTPDQPESGQGVYAAAPYRIFLVRAEGAPRAREAGSVLPGGTLLMAEGVVVTEEDVRYGREVGVPRR
jgi:dolichyl-phosphooligosaccharide-protein glycotransferase